MSISGCSTISTNDTLALKAGDYVAMLPFESSDTRVKHVGLISDQDLRIEIESGLMDLSKQYFDPSSVSYRTHVFLDFDELDATDGSRGLLGTLRDDNPNGLNPARDEPFDTGNGEVMQATILVDLYELDWYTSNDTLKGISMALVVNDEIEDPDGNLVAIKKDKLKNYIEVTAGKLVNYMRERFNDISARVPIYIAAYSLDSSEESLGGYFYEGMFEKSSGKYDDLNEKWVLVPSVQFTNDDPTTSEQFTAFKQDIQNVLPDYTYVTGKAKYENDSFYVIGNIEKTHECVKMITTAIHELSKKYSDMNITLSHDLSFDAISNKTELNDKLDFLKKVIQLNFNDSTLTTSLFKTCYELISKTHMRFTMLGTFQFLVGGKSSNYELYSVKIINTPKAN